MEWMVRNFQSLSPTNHSSVHFSCYVSVILSTPYTRALFQLLLFLLSCQVQSIFTSKSSLVSLSSFPFLLPFFILASIICHLGYWKSLLTGLLVSCLFLFSPSFTLSQIPKDRSHDHIVPSLEPSVAPSATDYSRSASFCLKG